MSAFIIKYKEWHEKYSDKSGANAGYVDVDGMRKWEEETGKKSTMLEEMPKLDEKFAGIYRAFLFLRRFFTHEQPINYQTMRDYLNDFGGFEKDYFFDVIKHLDMYR